MTSILIAGGAGGLGRELTPRLRQTAGHTVRVMSRQSRPVTLAPGLEWAQADIETGAGLAEAVASAEVIIHCASSPLRRTQEVDVDGTRKLVDAARTAKVKHVIYVSIVGIDRIPYPYYRHKLAAEDVVRQGGVPYSILRATQFHTLIDMLLRATAKYPFSFAFTDFKFQTVDTGEVAARLCEIAAAQPAGLLPDMGGPEVMTLEQMARLWYAAQGKPYRLLRLPLPGKVAHGFRNGYNTCPDHRDGQITWAEWVRRTYGGNGR
jgi:uncharacterized protein YbjT (DUF2867 family)